MKKYRLELTSGDKDDVLLALRAEELSALLEELDQSLRSIVKYDSKTFEGQAVDTVFDLADAIRLKLHDSGLMA